MAKRTELIEHVGWDLWRAADAWRAQFTQGMLEQRHSWYADARSVLLAHIDRDGVPQRLIAERAGLSKQAVKQFIDELERDGIVTRRQDPQDARGKIVTYTAAGLRALDDANDVKRLIERDYESRLGAENVRILKHCLTQLAGK
jgi:DNA-binding MarR family transcriptional regulator